MMVEGGSASRPGSTDDHHSARLATLGDVAKLAYAQDLKSCGPKGRVGSIPTIPTNAVLLSSV